MPQDKNCNNPKIVNVKYKLFSPKHVAGVEKFNAVACYLNKCGPSSYNGWVNATQIYIDQLYFLYKAIVNRTLGFYGAGEKISGDKVPIEIQNKLHSVYKVVEDWMAAGYIADKTDLPDAWFFHPFEDYWVEQISKIIDFFDRASCSHDELNSIATEIDSADLIRNPPGPPADEFYVDTTVDKLKSKPKDGPIDMLTIAALGAVAYIGYSALTSKRGSNNGKT